MKRTRIIFIILLGVILASVSACSPFGQNGTETTDELVEVKRGDLTVSISGSGSLEVSQEIKLGFGAGGKIEKLLTDEGDEVSEGGVIARLDTDALELALTQAQINQAQAQLAVTQGEVAVRTAEHNLEQTRDLYTLSDIKIAQADVDEAKRYVDYCLEKLVEYIPPNDDGTYPTILEYVLNEDYPKLPGYEVWQERLVHAQSRLNTAQNRLNAMLSGSDIGEIAIKKKQIEAAKESLALNEQSLKLAGQSLALAQKQLDDATLVAPFTGVVAKVFVDEGDAVLANTLIIHLIDLSSMELKIEVDEIDVTEVEPGQKAIIEVDALPDLLITGQVDSISTLSKVEGGLILYDAKITFDIPAGSGLRPGMSATADIITSDRSNILLIPDRAIKKDDNGNFIVEVAIGEKIEERTVITGISDGFLTEITDGLTEGEVVVIRRVKSTSGGGGFF